MSEWLWLIGAAVLLILFLTAWFAFIAWVVLKIEKSYHRDDD